MKTKKWIIILAVIGLIVLGADYIGLPDTLLPLDKLNNAIEKTEDLVDDNIAKPDIENKKNNIEDIFLEEGLIAYYPFNGNAKDHSGEGKNATNYGAAYVEGKEGKALDFDNRDDYVHAADNYVYAPIDINPISMPQITMTAWVKAGKGSIVVRQIIGNQGDSSDYNRSMGTDFRGGGKGWSCFAGTEKVLGYEPVVVDKWTFIATVYDQEAGTVKLFVDGSIYEKDGILTDNGNDHILIGARGVIIEKQSHHFNGVIDEVKIYDYALSDVELNSLFETGIAQPVLN